MKLFNAIFYEILIVIFYNLDSVQAKGFCYG